MIADHKDSKRLKEMDMPTLLRLHKIILIGGTHLTFGTLQQVLDVVFKDESINRGSINSAHSE